MAKRPQATVPAPVAEPASADMQMFEVRLSTRVESGGHVYLPGRRHVVDAALRDEMQTQGAVENVKPL